MSNQDNTSISFIEVLASYIKFIERFNLIDTVDAVSKNFNHSYRHAGDKFAKFEEDYLPCLPVVSSRLFFVRKFLYFFSDPVNQALFFVEQIFFQFSCFRLWDSGGNDNVRVVQLFWFIFFHTCISVYNNIVTAFILSSVHKNIFHAPLTTRAQHVKLKQYNAEYKSEQLAPRSQLNLVRRLSYV